MTATCTTRRRFSGTEPIRLVLVEDDERDATQLRMALHGAEPGYDVAVARTLGEALGRADGDDFELVLCDLGLPDSHGLETFVRCKERWPDKPIVILSGLEDEGLAREAVKAGAQDFLVKWTSSRPELRRALRHAIERHRNAARERAAQDDEQTRRRLEAVGRLAAGVAHEINTSLQYVGDSTRFLDESFRGLTAALRRVERAVEQARERPAEQIEGELRGALEDADLDYLAQEVPRAIAESLEGIERARVILRSMTAPVRPS